MTDDRYFEELTERYFNGLTSESEEAELRRFYLHSDVPEHLKGERDMFLAFDGLRLPDGFDKRLEQRIDSLAADERRGRMRLWLRRAITPLSGVAACLVLAIAATVWPHRTETAQAVDLTPEEIGAQTNMALTLLAETLGKGMDGVATAERVTCVTASKAYDVVNK
ncbi:MAG: hypothetical protein K2H14_10205 [Muribaculaceae bacterium]|nr:hypothetical protein [Muribaculaceae bacterium]